MFSADESDYKLELSFPVKFHQSIDFGALTEYLIIGGWVCWEWTPALQAR
jgi:hypothetical protein